MAFDKEGFAKWLQQERKLKRAPDAYPLRLQWLEQTATLDVDSYVPAKTGELIVLLEPPGRQAFAGKKPKDLRDAQTVVRRYDEYIHERDHLPKRRSMILFGLWKGKMQLAPDALSPEEYRSNRLGDHDREAA